MSDREVAGSSAVEIGQKERSPDDPAPTGSKLPSASNTIAWSAAIAVLTGFATCAGMARGAGTRAALCLYALSRPTIDQRDTYMGMISILDAALAALVVFVAARAIC